MLVSMLHFLWFAERFNLNPRSSFPPCNNGSNDASDFANRFVVGAGLFVADSSDTFSFFAAHERRREIGRNFSGSQEFLGRIGRLYG
jgi:hypothetical protein